MASLNSFERLMLINSKGSAEVVRKKEAAFRAFLDKLHENNDAILNETSISDVSSKAILDALKGYYAILGIDEKDTEFFKGKNLQDLHEKILTNYLEILKEKGRSFSREELVKELEEEIKIEFDNTFAKKNNEIFENNTSIQTLQQRLINLQHRVLQLKNLNKGSSSGQARDDNDDKDDTPATVEGCQQEIEAIEPRINQLKQEKATFEAEKTQLEKELKRRQNPVSEIIKLMKAVANQSTTTPTSTRESFETAKTLSTALQELIGKISKYNKAVPSAKTRELSTGANVLGNLIIDQNTKDGWTSKIYTSMLDAKEIDANYDPNAVTISSVAVPGGQKESSAVYAELRGNERYIRSREFECNVPGSQGQPSRIEKHKGILVQESNGTVTNYSEKEVVENKAAMQETALRMAAMYLLNYPGTGAIKIKGGPLKMALAVHAAIANLLPNVEIKNYSAKKEDLETGFFKSKNEVLREKYLDTISQDLLKDMAAELKVIVDKTKEVQEKYQKTAKDFKGGTSLFRRKYDTADAAREAADAEKNATIQEGRKVLR